ncbi:MAG: glycosyltransferase [Schwartzia sp. (in: firmicutes)]
MVKISACVIVKDEEKNLPRWLDSVKRIAGEIVVVDTGSSDGTVAIAEAAGAKVYHFPWKDDFAAAKNFALDQASGDWVIFPDADEYFSAEDAPKVTSWIRRVHEDERVMGLLCRCVNLEADGTVRNTILQARVFRRLSDLHYRGAVHESLSYTGAGSPDLRFMTDVCLYHTGYAAGLIRGKMERNLALLLRRREAGDAAYIADCYYGLGDFARTEQYAREAIRSGVRLVGRETRPHGLLIQSLIAMGRPLAEVLDAVEKARQEYPMVGDFSVLGGLGAERAGAYPLAEGYFRQGVDCYARGEGASAASLRADDRENLWPLALSHLGTLAKKRGSTAEALDYFSAALSRAPHQEALLVEVGRLLRGVPAADAIAFFHTIYDKEKDAAYLARALLKTPLREAALYYDRQAGGKALTAAERFLLAGRLLAFTAETVGAAERACRLGLWAEEQGGVPGGEGALAALLPSAYRRAAAGQGRTAQEKQAGAALSRLARELSCAGGGVHRVGEREHAAKEDT